MGRNVGAVPDQLSRLTGRSCTFVAAMGGSPQVGTGINPNDICRRLAERFGGKAESLYAPAYAESAASREAFVRHSDVRETLGRARLAQTALVGIGDARNDSAVVQMGCFSAAEMSTMREAGAVGDILGFFFDLDGRPAGGGIGPEIYNSFYILMLTLIFTVPIAVAAGVYIQEYALPGMFRNVVFVLIGGAIIVAAGNFITNAGVTGYLF